MDELALKLFAILKEISLCCQDREVIQARAFGLTPAEARCLIALKLNTIHTTADLAGKLLVAKSRVTRILDGMVKKGLVTRREGLEDRRTCLVNLTPQGEKITEQYFDALLEVHREVLKTLPDKHRDAALKILESLFEAMDTVKTRLDREISAKSGKKH
jgi:DNA-binding MarR family transcriptional regulator